MATHADVLAKVKQIWSHGIPASGRPLVQPAEATVKKNTEGFTDKVFGKPKCHMCGEELGEKYLLVKTTRGRKAKMCVDLKACGSRYVKNQARIVQKAQETLDEQVKDVIL